MAILNSQRGPARLYTVYAAAVVGVYILLGPLGLGRIPFLPGADWSRGSSGNTADFGIKSTAPTTADVVNLKMSRILNHAPGYTVVENLYWFNYSYVFITDQPWQIPTPHYLVVNMHVDTRTPTHGHQELKIYAIKNEAISPEVKEEDQMGVSIDLEEAIKMTEGAVELSSPMMINNDDNFVSHFYHWIGETFLGGWRVWSNLAWRTGATLPNFKAIAFPKQYNKADVKSGNFRGESWEDPPGANKWFTEKFFPGVTIESRKEWQERADSSRLYRIPLAVIADRRGGHFGPSAAWKPWGDVLRMPVSRDWLVNLRQRVLRDYSGPTPLRKGSIPRVTYVERQGSGRALADKDHDDLVKGLQALQDEGLAEVNIETFDSSVPFEEQVAKISVADFLVSVHGNGLTHTLWLDPGAHVFELQPADCTITDYNSLAVAANVNHYLVHETNFCLPRDCPKRGCAVSGGINREDIPLDSRVVTDQIRLIIRNGGTRL